MKFLIMTICLVVLAFALVSALPAVNDESIFGGIDTGAADDTVNPQDPQAILLKKLLLKKKLLLLG
ncbi:hypothetical protein CpipJ_CPIJ011255 [Culex quinquefasciatus]|uniref:Uncharacterized protein n=1 Tax=Culex quinquefasciatus TaxID=7176 RepID=B0WX15_CULQU|nr:hypothetical protein CpipJ_CPIJ011255 [Culex quinquefasciatus]|eukprot:XP_001861937.1 hypothetical protein CpipJ_CPIJ011255 [Culex quinquefasciatus]